MSDDNERNINGNYFNSKSLMLNQPLPLILHPAEVYLRSLSEGSRRTMREALNKIASLLTDNTCDAIALDWSKLKYQHTTAVRSMLMERYSPAMANKMIAALRRTLKEAWRLELMTREDYARAADIPSVRGKSLLKGRALNDKEISVLWEHCLKDNSNLGARDAALLGVLTIGLRRSEVTHLNVEDFKSRTRSLTIRETKGDIERIVYLPSYAVEVIKDWLLVRGKEPGPLFYPLTKGHRIMDRRMSEQGILRALQRRGESAGVTGFTPHDFRRTFIGNLLDAGADIVTVSKLAGHASPVTTSKYDRRGEDAKKRAIDLLKVPLKNNLSSPNKTLNKKNQVSKASTHKCPNCKSKQLLKDGFELLADGQQHQRFRCKDCSYVFTPPLEVPKNKV